MNFILLKTACSFHTKINLAPDFFPKMFQKFMFYQSVLSDIQLPGRQFFHIIQFQSAISDAGMKKTVTLP